MNRRLFNTRCSNYFQWLFQSRQISLAQSYYSQKKEEKVNKKIEKIQKYQQIFQKDDGRPIYLKRGILDQISFQMVNVGLLVGLSMMFYMIYCMMYNVGYPPNAVQNRD